jgi:cell division protein ZapA (FtsZ GTPase activity inhibitor)
MVNLVTVLNTLDELSKARAKIVELRAKCAERRHQEDGFPTPAGTQHP